jgi:hypothetical protein
MRATINGLVGVTLMVALSGCASLPSACLPPQQSMLSAELAFGRTIGDRIGVSDADFARFTAEEITPRFPDGLTVFDGHGQWRDPARGRLVREPSKLVWIVFADDPAKRAALTEIAEAYKRRFQQQSVLVAVRPSCVSF